MKQHTLDLLSQLRTLMQAAGLQAVIINKTDPHQSEYIGAHWNLLREISTFTGSNATMVVTAQQAWLWTDSRYFLQAAQQLQGTTIGLMKEGLPGVPGIEQWLVENLHKGNTVGINGMLFSATAARTLKAELAAKGIGLCTNFDPTAQLWPERPALPGDKIFIVPDERAGLTPAQKITAVLERTAQSGASAIFLSALDEIAWTLNIRSHDVPYTTVATAFLYLSPGRKVLFTMPSKLDAQVQAHLAQAGVETAPYTEALTMLRRLPEGTDVLVEPQKNAILLVETLGGRAVEKTSPVAMMKAVKNDTELAGVRRAMARDGVALVEAFMDIERRIAVGEPLTELDVERILRTARAARENFFDESFGTIAGFGPHGAIVHYEATPESNATIEPGGLLLVDSGAQYYDGTTDITRTISVGGNPTPEQKRDFTLVMKGHIALASAIFPDGTTGHQLDALARQFLWANGLNYLHGTGHGVGHFMNVHEGPQSIRLNHVPVPLTPGMITSNEPGLYRENLHGIRCENLVLTVSAFETEFGKFNRFEPLTMFPWDRTLFDLSLMSAREIEWVDQYHATVRATLTPFLNSEQRTWLEKKTAPLC